MKSRLWVDKKIIELDRRYSEDNTYGLDDALEDMTKAILDEIKQMAWDLKEDTRRECVYLSDIIAFLKQRS